ncbi:RNA polymerase RpoS-like sigma 38 subunit [Arenicella xantha]|uniref:RNA polymerase sigma factor n=2 Tax=Arenicella xantha TaxID=644221 RepID=A0A395JKP1_9GAMM|nr:RNA polymerase RpoS-like sigma 38 subunit [Arenicella xantha]
MRDIEFVPLLTAAQELDLGRRVQQGDAAARDQMIESNLRLVVKIARKYFATDVALMDLIEEGNIGLMHAVEKYDPEKGFRFSTYAAWWIRHEIERFIMNQSRTVRLPIHIVRALNKYKRVSYELVQTLQHEPNLREISDYTDHTMSDLGRLINLNRSSQSVDAPLGGNAINNFTLLDAYQNKDSENPMAVVQQHEVHDHLVEWLDFLADRPRDIIERRYGLQGYGLQGLGLHGDDVVYGEPQTLDQVAEAVGLTRERVRQIQMQALEKLRAILINNGYTWDDVSAIKK